MPLPLLALAIASFGIGTTEFVIMGMLPDLAQDLRVTIPQAGMLVTAYALSVVVGAPILAVSTARLPRKSALIGLMGIFIFGNFCCAVAPTYGLLMTARIITALSHGTFFGIGAVVAAGLVPRHKRGQAISLMFSGLTLANVLGVPLGTALGHELGWRATFWAVVAIGVIAAAALALWLPRGLQGSSGGSLLGEFRVLGRPQVAMAMMISVISSASLFSVLTYITPLLEHVTGFSPDQVTYVLLLFGVGLTVGNLVGGRLADWKMMPVVMTTFGIITLILVALVWTSATPLGVVPTLVLWGIAAFSVGSPLQMRVVDQARGAPNLASTLNQGAFNMGNALGAWFGGIAIDHGVAYGNLPWLGAGLAVCALSLTAIAAATDKGGTQADGVQDDDACPGFAH
ncbi:DHA1 family inner membrane transport protein [Nitrospirillum amazonense]|uniref:DHA1 family inner membrane transport protein n=1 Tax=Nitrospirillum amazonense TaxID=28077 RepID=A0A560F587_9PROT|nr:MFS transporter [Nitrospirillum amazonense]TWB16705.1 DHA1 family inner membrane transport protein [Nitrospirillum amazonense]